MPLQPIRQQFAQPGPQIPGQAVLGALQPPQASMTQGAPVGGAELLNPQHEALKRMLGMQGRPVY